MNDEVLRLHERGAADYETGIILNEAYNIGEQRKINDIACLEFDYPMDEKARLIQENMLVSCTGRIYEILRITRKMDGRDIVHVVCEDVFSYKAKKTFLPNVPDMIGKKTSVVIKKALETAVKFSLYTDAELEALGMEWVGKDKFQIDFFSTDKTSLWNFLQSVIENCGRGEIYSNGYKFALVERIGSDRGVRLTLDKNMQNIDIERSTEDIITKLWAFGAEDLPLINAKLENGEKYGKAYILSPNADIYGVHEGYRDYSDYTNPDKVYANAKWEFDPENKERIDIPKLTISGKLIDLSKLEEYGDIEKVELGDTVHVYDVDGNEYAERVIEGTWHPFEPTETLISIGHMRRDMFFTLYQLRGKKRELEAVQTTNKQITTRKMQGIVNTDRNEVQSDNELLKIIGDLLTIRDNSRIRVRLGNYNGEFVFIIYDKKGNRAIYLNEQGAAVFSGSVDTKEDMTIGSMLNLHTTENAGASQSPAINFWNKNNELVAKIACAENGVIQFVPIAPNSDVRIADNKIATELDIKKLQGQIDDLVKLIKNN